MANILRTSSFNGKKSGSYKKKCKGSSLERVTIFCYTDGKQWTISQKTISKKQSDENVEENVSPAILRIFWTFSNVLMLYTIRREILRLFQKCITIYVYLEWLSSYTQKTVVFDRFPKNVQKRPSFAYNLKTTQDTVHFWYQLKTSRRMVYNMITF